MDSELAYTAKLMPGRTGCNDMTNVFLETSSLLWTPWGGVHLPPRGGACSPPQGTSGTAWVRRRIMPESTLERCTQGFDHTPQICTHGGGRTWPTSSVEWGVCPFQGSKHWSLTMGNSVDREVLSLKRLVGAKFAIFSLLTLLRRWFWRAIAELGFGMPVPE